LNVATIMRHPWDCWSFSWSKTGPSTLHVSIIVSILFGF
jgi:hypothetical protein